jgi:hypothetical protein
MRGDRLGFHSLEDPHRFFGGVANYPANWALVYMRLQFTFQRGVKGVIKKIAQFLEKLFTGKQTRRPPCV